MVLLVVVKVIVSGRVMGVVFADDIMRIAKVVTTLPAGISNLLK
jgi:acylphosphatase